MNIPPLISRTPPPISNDDDDDFDDFESFVHDSIDDEVESDRSSVEPSAIPRIDDIKVETPKKSIKVNFENEIVDGEIGGFIPPETEVEFSSFASVQLDLQCDFNCDSNALNDAVIPENHSIKNSETNDIVLGENLLENSLVNGVNITDICTEFKEDCDIVEEKPPSVQKIDDTNHRTCESESAIETESKDLIDDFSNFTQFEEKLETFDFQSDDDFDDFADFQSSVVEKPPVATTSTFEEPKTNFFDNPWPEEIPLHDESQILTLNTNVINNRVWQKLQYLEDTPALKYTWSISTSNHKMLSALKIDSRNILYGPWSKSQKCLIPDGKNFEGLISSDFGKASCSEMPKASVPEAHFDWEGSGLTNPLFMVAKEENLLQYDLNSIVEKKISAEAESILKSLPNLSYLKKPYIVFNRSVS